MYLSGRWLRLIGDVEDDGPDQGVEDEAGFEEEERRAEKGGVEGELPPSLRGSPSCPGCRGR